MKVRTTHLSKSKEVTKPVIIELFPAPVLFENLKVSIHLCIQRKLNYLPTIPNFHFVTLGSLFGQTSIGDDIDVVNLR